MKYFKTEMTIFELVGENDLVYRVISKNKKSIYSKSKCQTNVIKQADTIEELCDVFVLVGDFFEKRENIINQGLLKEIEEDVMAYRALYMDCELYGAIWTKKGLLYVARFNEEGELELL